ncbi:MAG: GGDEF domain-containing protein [Aeromicrobium sp.]
MNDDPARQDHVSIDVPSTGPTADVLDARYMRRWHVRGAIRYAIALLIMLAASAVNETISLSVVAVLLGAACVVGVIRLVLASTRLDSRRWSLLLWPVATCASLSVLHSVSEATSALLSGLIVLAFQFIGITQPRGRGLWFILPAALLFIQLLDVSGREALVRLPIAMLVWLVVCEVPARLIGDLRATQVELATSAATDSLTGLLNRSRLSAHLADAGATGAVAVLDIDNFKAYNDARGHGAGDVALTDFATMLTSNTRPADRVFRYGGEEFLVIFTRSTTAEAGEILDRFARVWADHESGLTFSAGIADGGDEAVREADGLLYQAKRSGRNRVLTAERARNTP